MCFAKLDFLLPQLAFDIPKSDLAMVLDKVTIIRGGTKVGFENVYERTLRIANLMELGRYFNK